MSVADVLGSGMLISSFHFLSSQVSINRLEAETEHPVGLTRESFQLSNRFLDETYWVLGYRLC